MLHSTSLCCVIIITLVSLPTTAILTYQREIITNQKVEVTQGSRVSIFCRGGNNPNWTKGTDSTATSLPAGVTQTKSGPFKVLEIQPVTPENMGKYACHITKNDTTTIETVTVKIKASESSQPTPVSTPTPPPSPPSKVQDVAVTRTVQGSSPALKVSWRKIRGSSITYTVCYSKTSGTQSDPPSNAKCGNSGIIGTATTLGPLSRGTTYYIWVVAVSLGGQGPYSDRRQGITYNVPGQITSFQVRPSTTIFGLIMTWGPPSGSNYPTPVTYQLRYRESPSSRSLGSWSSTVQRTATQRQYATPVLKPGTRYEVEVWAVSDVGNGQSISRTANTRQSPGQVTLLKVRPSAAMFRLIITWGPPSGSNYPTPVTYQLRYRERPNNGPLYSWSRTRNISRTLYITPALTPETRYEVQVWTFVSNRSGPVRTISGTTASGSVQALTVRSHGTQIALVVTWRPPSDIINPTGYRLRNRKTPSSTWSSTKEIGSQQTQYTITGLEEGGTYEVEVWATFRSGEGSRRRVAAITTTLRITTITNNSITLVPSPPSGTVYYKEVGSSAQPRRVPYSNTVTITQLQPNTEYNITYVTGNELGVSRVEQRQFTLPNAVSHLKLSVVSSKSVNIFWKEPENSNSLMYHINYSSPMSKSNTSISPRSTTLTLTGLHPYEEYTISVQAGNDGGLSLPVNGTTKTYSDVPKGQPRSLRSVKNGSTWIHVAWDIPLARDRNGIIINYIVDISPKIGNVTIPSPTATFSTTELITYNITGLNPGTEYAVRVAASTVNGTGPFSAGSTFSTRPGPVRNLAFEVNPLGVVKINWAAPSVSNVLIVAYELIYTIIGDESMSTRKRTNAEGKACLLNGLEPEKPYTVTVRAYTSAGPGENQTIIVFAREGVPSKSVDNIIVKRRLDHSVIVTWTPLSYTEAKGFPFYIVTYAAFDGSSSGNTTSISDSAVLVGLYPAIGYKISVEVTTGNGANRGNDTSTVTCVTLSPQDSFPVGAVVGVLLALILVGALVAVVVVIYLCCKRNQACTSCQSLEVAPKPSRKKKKKANTYEMQPSPEETYYISLQVGSMEPIPQNSFSIHVKAMHMERDSGFEREFQTIANDPAGSEEIAIENRPKNRYLNIHTFDHSRVVLSGNKESDYINASFIDGYQRSNAYIASQGPLPNTIADFWEMVWEQRSPVIVMLTKLEEKGKVKCEKYWNDELDTPYDLSRNLTVTTRSYKAMADYEIRDIRVVKANGSRNKPLDVVQMQYNGWPDYGVPSHPSSLVKFVQQVRKEYKNSTAPLLVHCSAGVGRTGTFITIDAMLERLQEKDDLNVYQFVTAMRSQRTFMVQTMDQYAFIHDALNDHLTCGDTSVPAHHLRSVIAEMSGLHQETSSTGFEEQFEFLDSLCKKTCDEDDTYSRKGTITKKNRYSDKFPYSYNHLKLHSKTNTNGGDYINASFVDSYSKSKAFIAAQAPLENTKNDIWQLIWQYKMPTVVVLCDFQEDNEETCCKFWPDEVNRSIEYDYLKVNHKDVSYADSYEMVKLDVFDKSMESKVHNVTLFHTKNWPKNGPVDPDSILKLMGDVEGAHGGKKKPIFVLCDDGMGRSGVFICAMSEVERVKVEGEVDVFQTVKSMRSQRPHMVDTPEQYKLCFEILLTHLDSFDTYANFKAV